MCSYIVSTCATCVVIRTLKIMFMLHAMSSSDFPLNNACVEGSQKSVAREMEM